MTALVLDLLEDYGTIPKKIGEFLLFNNGSRYQNILKSTNLTDEHLTCGLSILIQRRFIKFFVYEKDTYYTLDTKMIERRIMFPMYVFEIEELYGSDLVAPFIDVLINGMTNTKKINCKIDELINTGVIKTISTKKAQQLTTIPKEKDDQNEEMKRKTRKIEKEFYTIDFDVLDNLILNREVTKMVKQRYSNSGEIVYKALLRCNPITSENIIDNLESSRILIMDNEGPYCDEKNINEYLRYLENFGLIEECLGSLGTYLKNIDSAKKLLLIENLKKILSKCTKGALRLLLLLIEHESLEDKEITLKSLLGSYVVKKALFSLHSKGFTLLKTKLLPENGSVLTWYLNMDHTSKFISNEIKKKLKQKISDLNKNWNLYYSFDTELDENDKNNIKNICGLSLLLFSFGAIY